MEYSTTLQKRPSCLIPRVGPDTGTSLLALELHPPGPSFPNAGFDAGLACLGPVETARVLRYRHREDQERSLAGALLSRLALAAVLLPQELGSDPWSLAVSRGPTGRPHLEVGPRPAANGRRAGRAAGPVAQPAADFNLSHAGSWVVCLAARGARVGIDVEELRPVDPGIYPHCLNRAEQEALAVRPPAERLEAFFTIWTAKEARLKAIGTGLATPPASVSAAAPEGWRLTHLWLDKKHLLAMCVERPARPPRRPTVLTPAELLDTLPGPRHTLG